MQRNLELFLMWNKPKQNNTYLIDFHFNKKPINLKKKNVFLVSETHLKRQAKGSFSNKLYKPIQSNSVLNKFRSEFSKTVFFPYKKPFMQFWIFPFFGACYLSF